MKLKDACSLKRSYDQPRQHIEKQRHYFANKCPSSQSYGFSSSHVWKWELDHKEIWAPKNWNLWTLVLGKTLESPLDCKEIKAVNHKGNKSWIFIGRTEAEAESPILWPPDVRHWLIGKDPDALKDWRQQEKRMAEDKMVGQHSWLKRQQEKGTTEDEMVGWHNWLNGHEFEQAPGVGDGQRSLASWSPWSRMESDMTE